MASQSEASTSSGALIAGKYRLEALLGRGGMGAVYSARHVLTGRRFAVKLLSRELTGDPGAEERFMREAMLASSIQHPAIVEVYDVGRDRGMPYMVMKLLQGETLGDRLTRGPLAPGEAVELLMPVIDGIAAAHAHGIVHRDLKPDNVLIEREGEREHPRVLDFGISKLLGGGDTRRPAITRPGMIIGTPEYMAPEQVRGEPELDARCDVYALGVMLYEMLTGSLPFAGKDLPALLLAITEGTVPGIRARCVELPIALESVVARAMDPDRELRYRDAAELGRALLALGLVRPSQLGSFAPGLRASSSPALRRTPASGPRISDLQRAPTEPHASPSTPAAELSLRRTLPPAIGWYAGATLVALVALIAISGLPGTPRPLHVPSAATPAPAPAPTAQQPSVPANTRPPSLPIAPAPPGHPLPLAAVTEPIVEPFPEPSAARRRRSSRAERNAARASEPGVAGPSEETSPRAKPRLDMRSLTSEILDPFE